MNEKPTQEPQTEPQERPAPIWMNPLIHCLATLVLFCLFALPYMRYGNSVPSFTWSWVYSQDEFVEICKSWDSIKTFYRDLRVPIPPVIAGLEILSYRLSGSFDLVTIYLYRALAFAAFFLSIIALKRGVAGYWWSAAQAMIFTWATINIHQLNPQIYDLWVPCFFLLYVFLLRKTGDKNRRLIYSLLLAFLSGMSLALVETARPFVLVLLPFLIIFSIIHLGKKRWPAWIIFVIPIIVISGGWHLKLYLYNEGQLLSTNNSGFNLRRCWEPVLPLPEAEVKLEDGWKLYNNPRHIEVSNELKSKVVHFIITHPFISAKHTTDRISELFAPMTKDVVIPLQLGIAKPLPANHPWLPVYVLFVRVSGLFLLACLIYAFQQWLRAPSLQFFGAESWILMFFTGASIFILAVGESGEDYRFLISVLPCLAAISPVRQGKIEVQKKHLMVPVFLISLMVLCGIVKANYDKHEGRLFLPDNVAQTARAEVSSYYGTSKPFSVNDGVVAGHPGPMEYEWVSNGEKEGAWAKLIWDATQTVNRVSLYDRPNSEDQVLGGTLFFSDGSFIPFSQLDDTALVPYEIRFEPREITSLTAVINQVKPKSPNIGFAEIAVFQASNKPIVQYEYRTDLPPAQSNLALTASATASSTFTGYSADGAMDGVIGGSPQDTSLEWASQGEGAGAWLRLQWDEPQKANRIMLFDRPNTQDQVFSGIILINDHIQYAFGTLLDDASQGLVIKINEMEIQSLDVIVMTAKAGGPNVGLSEVAVFYE